MCPTVGEACRVATKFVPVGPALPPGAHWRYFVGHVVEDDDALFTNTRTLGNARRFWTWAPGAPAWSEIETLNDGEALDLTSDRHGTLYAATNGCSSCGDGGVVRRSLDRGKTWNATLSAEHQISALATDGCAVYVATRDDVRRSTDGGMTWDVVTRVTGVRELSVTPDGTAYAVALRDHEPFLLRGAEAGTWTVLPSVAPMAVAASARGVYVVETGTSGWTVKKSADHGASWQTLDDYRSTGPNDPAIDVTPMSIGVNAGGAIVVDGFIDPEIGGMLFRLSSDDGATWASPGLDADGVSEPSLRDDGSIALGFDGQLAALACR
jgi:hypothetical protein